MIITIIINGFYPATYYGGPTISNYHLACELAKQGHTIYVSTTNANGTDKLDIDTNTYIKLKENLYVIYYGMANKAGFSPLYFIGLNNEIRKSDIIYIQPIFSPYVPFALLSALLFRKKILMSPRGCLGSWTMSDRRPLLKKLWIALFIKPFQNSITWHAASLQEHNDISNVFPKARISVIPNGVDLAEYKNVNFIGKREYALKFAGVDIEYDTTIVSLGRLHAIKGFDILIYAFSKLMEKHKRAALFIAGPDGGEKKILESLISSLGLSENVFLVGEVNGQDKVDFLGNASVFALASHGENFGNVYVESLAAGTPIVASKNTPWQIVENYQCGKWVPNTENDFAHAIDEILCGDRSLYKKNALNLVHDKFDWSSVAKQFSQLFSKMLNNKINDNNKCQ